ncbi:AMP-binding protein [Reyranella sp.]|uniref:AMP-binding protein n=1 Tax=Reyranella sp. TaxID=1929291 RepID=UPI003BA9D61C
MNAFLSAIRRHVDREPERTFCQFVTSTDTISLTWRDFGINVSGYTRRFGSVEPGVVLIFLKHTPHLYWAFFGAMFAGLVPSFMPCLSLKQDPAIYWGSHVTLLRHIKPVAIVSDAETFSEMQANGLDLAPYCCVDVATVGPGSGDLSEIGDATTIALLQHSSGTTGLKKGVALSFAAIVCQLDSYSAALAIDRSDVIVSWLPVYHDMGLVACLLLPTYVGIPLVHIDTFHWLTRPGILLEYITTHKGTLCWLPNFAFEHIERTVRPGKSIDLGSVRALINCSEPCRAPTFDRFLAKFRPLGIDETKLQVCYAMAEAVFAVTQTELTHPAKRFMADTEALQAGWVTATTDGGTELVSAGREIDGIEALVLDRDGGVLPEGRVGEIGLRGKFLFSGYYKDPALSASRSAGGVYRTGDLGFRRGGELFIVARIDDLLIINGKNIYAHEVEAIVNATVCGVKPGRVAAISIFNATAGSDVLVVIAEQLEDGADANRAKISEAVFSQIGVTPWDIRIVPSGWLVKTTSGKTSRKENRLRYLSEVGHDSSGIG